MPAIVQVKSLDTPLHYIGPPTVRAAGRGKEAKGETKQEARRKREGAKKRTSYSYVYELQAVILR